MREGDGSVALDIVFSGDAGEFVPHVITSTTDGTATGNDTVHVMSILHKVTCTHVVLQVEQTILQLWSKYSHLLAQIEIGISSLTYSQTPLQNIMKHFLPCWIRCS